LSEPQQATDALLSKPVWTVEDVASFLSLPVKTIYKQRADGDFCPGHRLGRHLRFKRDDVLRWLETKRDEA
jgi:excisionase family DNA binding protein